MEGGEAAQALVVLRLRGTQDGQVHALSEAGFQAQFCWLILI